MTPSVNDQSSSLANLALLAPTVSWAQRRADKDRELQYQAMLAQNASAEKQQLQQAALSTQQAIASLSDVPFLEADQLRFKDLVDGILAENGKRIESDYGGDHERYGRERYLQDSQTAIMKATRSPLFRQALQRRSYAVQLMADQSKGLIDRPVTYRLLNGQLKTAPATENYRDFQSGKTEEFSYDGGYNAPTKYNDYFAKNYHPRAAVEGNHKVFRATGDEVLSAMMSEDGLSQRDAVDYLTRFGNRLAAPTYKFDPRDPYKEIAIQQRNRALAQGDRRNQIAEARLKVQQRALGSFNAYDTSIDARNIITTDAYGTPMAIPATVYDQGKPDKKPWALVGYDSQLIQPQILKQLGIQPQKGSDGTTQFTPGKLSDAMVMAPNEAGGLDLRKTNLSGVNYQVVGAGEFYRRPLTKGDKSAYEKAGGQEQLYQQLTIRVTAREAIKAKSNPLFRNIGGSQGSTSLWFGITPNVDSQVGAGAYKEAGKNKDDERLYDFQVLVPVRPSGASRATMENTNTGRWMDSKAGGRSMSDIFSEGPAIDLFDGLDND